MEFRATPHEQGLELAVVDGQSDYLGDGPASALYVPSEHSYMAGLEQHLSPMGLLAVDIVCRRLEGMVQIRLSDDGKTLVFRPDGVSGFDPRMIFGSICRNFTNVEGTAAGMAEAVFGPDAEPLYLSFVGSMFKQGAVALP